ncbi:MAG TPA: xanthine dehydrogenase family protein subunit M [Candidatus Pseudogracilibacillus intestinigallinarum]|uniref:Xanthine dehydrogenase family protein subunit M n=1 Tax=Candidatus Pseudogracilibacillus intestinigallinarum TaxID=2838742 RepID=A0A9D1PKP4_9BACI|nr:xanthine dehydrogenase family protein subunit M [Candidatus Pseudogracilibacillus intestinigallinarum]
MIPAKFDYKRAKTVEEAVQLLKDSDGEGTILAGGHSLLPLLKFRITEPGLLVDISKIEGLKGARIEEDRLVVGALTTHYDVSKDELILDKIPALAKAASVIGDLQIRNRGTIGGNLAHGDPVADYPAVAIALDASLKVVSEDGEEDIPLEGFVLGPLITSIPETGMVTEVSFELPPAHAKQTYVKFFHPATAYPVVGVAVIAGVDENNEIDFIRVGITGVGDVAYRAEEVEDALEGQTPSAELIDEAAQLAAEDGDMGEDLFASEEYREHLTKVFVKRALKEVLL